MAEGKASQLAQILKHHSVGHFDKKEEVAYLSLTGGIGNGPTPTPPGLERKKVC